MEGALKLIIQIPCLNEREHLPETVRDLPRSIPGVDEIEVLIVDDGSTDDTSAVAREIGVHHIVRMKRTGGLANAFMGGIDACLRLGADIIVNTDADNQYRGSDIPALVAPLLAGRADLAIGDRQTDRIGHFSPLKKVLQRWGSRLVRGLSDTEVADSPSGFRAFNRKAAYRLFVHNRFTYTLETVIQAGRSGLVIENVTIATNPKTRESRLFKSIPDYLRRAAPVMFRAYAMYRPAQTFLSFAGVFLAIGVLLGVRFVYHYLSNPNYSGFVQSLLVGVGAIILAFLIALVALLSELLAANRRLLEEILARTRRIDATLARGARVEGVETTGSAAWVASQPREAGDDGES
jgi:glycosyltransferase involved in cell wall biosynthesis